jgi:hypothetical protein
MLEFLYARHGITEGRVAEECLRTGIPASEEWIKVARDIIAAFGAPVPCAQCGEAVEAARKCYAIPTCYECLPPPEGLKVI